MNKELLDRRYQSVEVSESVVSDSWGVDQDFFFRFAGQRVPMFQDQVHLLGWAAPIRAEHDDIRGVPIYGRRVELGLSWRKLQIGAAAFEILVESHFIPDQRKSSNKKKKEKGKRGTHWTTSGRPAVLMGLRKRAPIPWCLATSPTTKPFSPASEAFTATWLTLHKPAERLNTSQIH